MRERHAAWGLQLVAAREVERDAQVRNCQMNQTIP